MSFFVDLSAELEGVTPEAVMFGYWGGREYTHEDIPAGLPTPEIGRIYSWDEAAPFLLFEWYRGFGTPACWAINVWTRDKIFFVDQYDGSTSIQSISRDPKPGYCPEMPGG